MVPRVFIPKVTTRFDPVTKRHISVHDLTPAMQFGQLTPVLDSSDDPNFLNRLTPKIKSALSTFTHEDYLLAVGDPCLIAVCSAIIGRQNPRFVMLKWQRESKIYVKMEIQI